MTEATRRQLKINEIAAGRGVYASLNRVQRCLLINDVAAGRK
jgi:hypothetical protein